MIGLKSGTIKLYDHEKKWEIEAQNTICRLKNILGTVAHDIQHVGSTSIPAIKAKPIIDIAIAVDNFDEIFAFQKDLTRNGFYYRPNADLDNQLLFACGSHYDGTGDLQTHFIHVVKTGSMEWINYINFRNYLNQTPTVAKEYENIKISLANAAPIDSGREKYLKGKHDFIVYTLRKALVKSFIGKTVYIKIDRPIGSVHPKHPDIVYPINYGYIPGVLGGDGEELDVYVLGVDKPLDEMRKEDIPAVTEIVKRCYNDIKELDKLLFYFNIEQQISEPGCTWYYKIKHGGECIGVINLAYVGMEAMVIRCFACLDSDINEYIFELLKQKFPDVLSWNIYIAQDDNIEDFTYAWNGKKRQFSDDNGFVFYTDSKWNRVVKMLKPHDEVYNSSRYRFTLLDSSMDGVAFRFFGIDKLDFYDGSLTNCRMTDVNFCNAVIYDTWLANSRFFESSIENSDFRFSNFSGSTFMNVSFEKCKFESCNLDGLTIDDIDVKKALEFYKENK